MRTACRAIGILIIILSLIPMWGGVHLYNKTKQFVREAVEAEAIVTAVEKRDGNTYYPLFTYYDEGGNEHTKYGVGSFPPAYKEGDRRIVLYDPLDPSKAKFDSFFSLWLLPLILVAVGSPPMLMGIGIAFLLPLAIGSRDHPPGGTRADPFDGELKSSTQERDWAMLSHLGALSLYLGLPFGNILLPLLVWLVKKDHSAFVEEHGRESLNFQISFTIYCTVAAVLCFLIIGFIILPLLFFTEVVLVVVAALRARSGRGYRYPCTIRLIR